MRKDDDDLGTRGLHSLLRPAPPSRIAHLVYISGLLIFVLPSSPVVSALADSLDILFTSRIYPQEALFTVERPQVPK